MLKAKEERQEAVESQKTSVPVVSVTVLGICVTKLLWPLKIGLLYCD